MKLILSLIGSVIILTNAFSARVWPSLIGASAANTVSPEEIHLDLTNESALKTASYPQSEDSDVLSQVNLPDEKDKARKILQQYGFTGFASASNERVQNKILFKGHEVIVKRNERGFFAALEKPNIDMEFELNRAVFEQESQDALFDLFGNNLRTEINCKNDWNDCYSINRPGTDLFEPVVGSGEYEVLCTIFGFEINYFLIDPSQNYLNKVKARLSFLNSFGRKISWMTCGRYENTFRGDIIAPLPRLQEG